MFIHTVSPFSMVFVYSTTLHFPNKQKKNVDYVAAGSRSGLLTTMLIPGKYRGGWFPFRCIPGWQTTVQKIPCKYRGGWFPFRCIPGWLTTVQKILLRTVVAGFRSVEHRGGRLPYKIFR